MSETEKINQ